MNLNPRRAVLIGLLVAQIAMVGALVAVSGRLYEKAESTHTDALLDTSTAEAVDQLRAHIAPAESIVDLVGQLGADIDAPFSVFCNTFVEALRRSPQLDGISIATADGGFNYASRDGDGYVIKTITITDVGPETELQYMDADGTVMRVVDDPDDDYDPRTRPWYTDATNNAGSVVWTDPYIFFTSNMLGISSAKTIERDGELLGVVAADIELGSLSTFLETLNVGDEGGAVVVTRTGTVIAHSDASLLQVETVEGFRTVNIDEFDDPTARAAVESLSQEPVGEPTITGFDSEIQGESRAAFRSIPVGQGGWTIGVYGPKNNFTGIFAEARARERWLVLGVGALTALVFFGLIALPFTRPIKNLEQQAHTDPLTHLPNRRAIMALAHDATAGHGQVALAMVDVDNFKQINDTQGHQTGDQVLQVIARRIKSAVRDTAEVGRIGGEEFLVVFPITPSKSAIAACERIREAIAASPISTGGERMAITVSVGIVLAHGDNQTSDLMKVADEALRVAKNSGKNQVRSLFVGTAPSDSAEDPVRPSEFI